MRFASIVVVLDSKTYCFLGKVLPSKKVVKIANMIDLDGIDGLGKTINSRNCLGRPTENEQRVVFIGRAVLEKGLIEQVTACTELESVQLHVVGPIDDQFRQKLEQLARTREGGTWLHFHGGVHNEEARRQVLWSDIFVLPSFYEAFPNALLEAMALGKPAIVSRVGAMPEMIDAQGENPCGLCIEPADAASLKCAVKHLLEAPELRRVMGQRGRKRVEAFYSTEKVVEQLMYLWAEGAIQ
jgi:glycosyltransferase involved in cell wall biosynthesis